MMYNFYIVLAAHISHLSATAHDPFRALNLMYWSFVGWVILFLLWQISPKKDPFSGNEKLSRKQKKMLEEANRHQAPRF
jgi:hypothetical protein